MTKHLDPRFAKVVARMRSTTFSGERDAARIKAGKLAAKAGMTLDEAIRQHDAPIAQPQPANIFAGFGEWMEQREPGWGAKRAAEKASRNAAWAIRKTAILERYGSMQAALAPCWREALILEAVTPWRETRPDPERAAGWTRRLFDCASWLDPVPAHIGEAICTAYPLPKTFQEARAEDHYWQTRNDELDDLFSEDGAPLGHVALDLAANIRAEIVRKLARHELPTSDLADLHARFAMMRQSDFHEPEMVEAMFRDLSVMLEREAAHPSKSVDGQAAEPIRPARAGQITDALRADPSRSDRDIARALRCSPTTVGRVRRDLGLTTTVRSVRRGGQTFRMKHGSRSAA